MGEETFLQDAAGVPIYAELVRLWWAEGRAVPGVADPVWESLAAPPPLWVPGGAGAIKPG
ncbi:hypothetical protein PUR71_20910 [Streptomyces sp. SP17BM10]|uniref:hypothetical protein n=1 Tax=Streptomyces sp. SP17BM10 TaxID=3002530 RepID=UPI002E796510|nr:hypothetical protein [Streptomyces sp. SP17BM10]MEE1785354.1 hypothetical protein [Streptomyces sp. SP17BM10]